MRHPTRGPVLAGFLALAGAARAGESMREVVVPTEYVEFAKWAQARDRQDPADRLTDMQPRTVALSDARPAGVRRVPEGAGARYGAVSCGGRALSLVVVPAADGTATVALDANGDGDLAQAGESVTAPAQTAGPTTYWATRWRVGGASLEVAPMRIDAKEKGATWKAGVNVTGARRGFVDVGGVRWALQLDDRDFDGTYTGPEDRWWFGPAASQPARLVAASMVEANEPVFATAPWRLAAVDPDGRAHLVPDPRAGTVGDYFARRSERVKRGWFAQFDQEAPAFAKQNGVDLSRARAPAEPHWMHDVDLQAALARAKAERKPVLVDFEADWCTWCYRFEYYLYRDAEVAAQIDRFVAVKVNYEFHRVPDFEALNPDRSLPVVLVLDADGRPVEFAATGADGKPAKASRVTKFQPPERLAATLRAAFDAWAARR